MATDPAARSSGRACAVAVLGARALQQSIVDFPGLFPAGSFDAALPHAIALAHAFSAPWCSADDLRVTNRATLWAFAVDRLIDEQARDADEVEAVVAECRAVADGAAPTGELGRMLAGLDPLGPLPTPGGRPPAPGAAPRAAAEPAGRELVRGELTRMVAAMATDRSWRERPPTLADYLDNADNLGLSFVYSCHWVATEPATVSTVDIPRLLAAARAVQRALRVVNDLATAERDARTGDLNALRLGPDRAELSALAATLAAAAHRRLEPLRAPYPRLAGYLDRQLDFNLGFHPVTDYWAR